MNIFHVFSAEELEDLPEDNREAFVAFVRKAEYVLEERTRPSVQSNDEEAWRLIEDERHGFMNIVVAAAKRYNIEEFLFREVPQAQNFGHSDYKEFKVELDHYITQMMLDTSIRNRSDSVPLPASSKERLRSLILGIRECIDKADLTDAKREALHRRLTEFEGELEKSRLSILAVTRVTLEIMALGSGAWQAGDIVLKLMSSMMQEVASAKAANDETRRLPSTTEPAMLMPPCPPAIEKKQRRTAAPAFEGGMDDEIPF